MDSEEKLGWAQEYYEGACFNFLSNDLTDVNFDDSRAIILYTHQQIIAGIETETKIVFPNSEFANVLESGSGILSREQLELFFNWIYLDKSESLAPKSWDRNGGVSPKNPMRLPRIWIAKLGDNV